MNRSKQLLATVSTFALIAFSVAPAHAAGTAANSTITNNVTVNYSVGGVSQDAEVATDSFTVDRKVNLVVTPTGSTTAVSANQQQVVRTFEVQNLSNAAIGIALTAAQEASPDFNLSNVTIFDDANSNGLYDSGEATLSFINSLGPDQTVTVSVAMDIDSAAAQGEATDVILTANAFELNDPASEIAHSTGADTAGVDTVLADAAGITDSVKSGDHSAAHTVNVNAADLQVAKTSRVIWDPVNLFVNPKAVPGARVQYCIKVSNGASAATATGVTVNDPLPGDVSLYADAFGTTGDVMVNGTVDGATGFCTGGTEVDGYTSASTVVNESLADIAQGVTRTLYFQVEIN